MTAANVLDLHARLLGYAGQSSDAVSANTQVKSRQNYCIFPYRNVPLVESVYHVINGPMRGTNFKILSYLFNDIYTDIPWQVCSEKLFRTGLGTNRMEKLAVHGNVSSFIGSKESSYQCTWTTSRWQGEKINLDPMWKRLMKHVDLEKPTEFL